MTRTVYRAFACPKCLRLATRPWPAAWCSHIPEASVQGFNPTDDRRTLDWTPMIELDPEALRRFVKLQSASNDATLVKLIERMLLDGQLQGTGYTPDDVDEVLAAMPETLAACVCGHTDFWHGDAGRGPCEYHQPDCRCERFAPATPEAT